MAGAIRIIGIDPGLRRTGWGVVETLGNSAALRRIGHRRSDEKQSLAIRLCQLHDGLVSVIRDMAPMEAAVEATFVNKDAAATLKLGQARGIAMLVPALAGLAVAEYAPNAVKKAVIGVGHGEKRQIHMMVRGADAESDLRHRTTPPTRWPSPSAMRITARAWSCRLAALA